MLTELGQSVRESRVRMLTELGPRESRVRMLTELGPRDSRGRVGSGC